VFRVARFVLRVETERSAAQPRDPQLATRLAVARQPAIEVGLFFAMAFNAESHFKALAFDSVHGFDGSVTLPAFNFFSNVALVIKQHVFGQIIYFYPGR
jgi:hypothetical protein